MADPMTDVQHSDAIDAIDASDAPPPPSPDEIARLQRTHLRLWTETIYVDRSTGLAADFRELSAPVMALRFEYEGFVVAGSDPRERVFCAGRDGGTVPRARDRAGEGRARMTLEGFGAIELELLEGYAAQPGSAAEYVVQPEVHAQHLCAFTAHAVPQLRALGFEVEVADDYPYRVLTEQTPWYAVVTPDAKKPDWFALELGIEVDGHRVSLLSALLDLIDQGGKGDLARLAPESPRYVPVTGHGQYVEVPAERFRALLRVVSELYQGSELAAEKIAFPETRAPAIAELDEVFARNAGLEPLLLEAGEGVISRARALSTPVILDSSSDAETPHVRASLRPYQRVGVAWLERLRAHDAGGVLADDMGLGKTLQTIAQLARFSAENPGVPTLVITPTSLVGNWKRELSKFAPQLDVCIYFGPQRAAERASLHKHDIIITSYTVLLRDLEILQALELGYVVLDEAQAIKNPRSQAARAVKSLKSRHRIALSGTPIENHLGELWSLFVFAMPGLLGSEQQFRVFYAAPIESGDEERASALRSQVSPYVLRRMKEHVAPELPPKTELVRAVELKGKQRELYESIRIAACTEVRTAIRKKGLSGSTIAILDALMKLRQLCCDPRLVPGEAARFVRESAKLELLMELLDRQLADGRRVLLFSQFTSMLALIARALHDKKVKYTTLTGSTADRMKPVNAFDRGEADVFLISLKAGGTGLNLTSADTVIHYDPWWNPAAQEQATDRAYRIGQNKPVFVYRLIVAGSVEERMLALQDHKRRLAQAVIGSGDGAARLQEAEVEHLLAPLDDD
jgi:superfamily II DNA or RNA helicase